MGEMNIVDDVPNILMVGPGRNVMGGISTVVNSYFELGLNEHVNLCYITSMEDGSKLRKLFVAIKAYLSFKKCMKNYDIIHVHMAAQASFIRKSMFIRIAKKSGKKIIIHQHAADFDDYYLHQCKTSKQKYIKEIFEMADKVIVLSEEWAQFFGEYICDNNKIEIFHNGIVLSDYQKNDYLDHNILFLGRLGERKGTYDLLKVIPDVVKKIPDAMFYLGGDGEIDQCRSIVERSSVASHVFFLGWVRNQEKESYFKKCSTFVLPSYHEGMPMAVLEAMGYGLATISTNAGGIPQIIDNNINGYIIEPGDINKLKQKIIYLLENAEERKRLGQAAKNKIADRFNASSNISKLLNLYRQLEEM